MSTHARWALLVLLVLSVGVARAAPANGDGLAAFPAMLDFGDALPGSRTQATLNLETETESVTLAAVGDLGLWLRVEGQAGLTTVATTPDGPTPVAVEVRVPDSAAPGVIRGSLMVLGDGDVDLGLEIPVTLRVLDAGLEPAQIRVAELVAHRPPGSSGIVVDVDLENTGELDGAVSLSLAIRDDERTIVEADFGRVEVGAGEQVHRSDIINVDLAPGQYTASISFDGHAEAARSAAFTAGPNVAERGRVVDTALRTDGPTDARTLEVVVEHPGAVPALVAVTATMEGLVVVDEVVVVDPASTPRRLLFPVSGAPLLDGTELRVRTAWNSEVIDERSIVVGGTGIGVLAQPFAIAAAVAALAVGATWAGRRRRIEVAA